MNLDSARHVKWSVMWLGKNGYIVEKDFGIDLTGAIEAYMTLKVAKKKWVTLRSKNVGFPPPPRIAEREDITWKIVRRKGKRYRMKVVEIVNAMHEHNIQGDWWCPYCRELRKFVRAEDEVNLMCPVCEVTTRDFHVRNYNPNAIVVSQVNQRRRAPRAKAKPVRRNSRSR